MPGIYDTTDGKCSAVANLAGAHAPCGLASDHNGWAHQNVEHNLIWESLDVHV